MLLTDLKPKWVLPTALWSSPDPFYTGVSFECPCCRTQRLMVHFNPPIDPAGLQAKYQWPEMNRDARKWARSGDTFDTLTLQPSLDFRSSGHWHGMIINGVAITT